MLVVEIRQWGGYIREMGVMGVDEDDPGKIELHYDLIDVFAVG